MRKNLSELNPLEPIRRLKRSAFWIWRPEGKVTAEPNPSCTDDSRLTVAKRQYVYKNGTHNTQAKLHKSQHRACRPRPNPSQAVFLAFRIPSRRFVGILDCTMRQPDPPLCHRRGVRLR